MTGLRSMLSNHSHHLVQDSVPPSKVQRGRVGIPGDFSVPAVNGKSYIQFSLGIHLVAIQIRYQKLKHSIDRDLF